jgi:hypothetical protein
MSATQSRRGGCLLALAVLALASGCRGADSPRTYPVKGKVTYNGKPVPNGTITFVSASGQAATGEIRPDGSYELKTFRRGDGAVPGEHKVVIVAMEDTASKLPEQRGGTPPPIIPDKYTSVATTDLRAEVKAEPNTIDFTLVPGKKR